SKGPEDIVPFHAVSGSSRHTAISAQIHGPPGQVSPRDSDAGRSAPMANLNFSNHLQPSSRFSSAFQSGTIHITRSSSRSKILRVSFSSECQPREHGPLKISFRWDSVCLFQAIFWNQSHLRL